jgi:dsRNA-specific ribonuclease
VIRHHRYKGAWGITKKEAEQGAAYEALVELGLIVHAQEVERD